MNTTTSTADFSVPTALPMLTIGDRFACRQAVTDLFGGSLNAAKNPMLHAANARVMTLNDGNWNHAFPGPVPTGDATAADTDRIALVFRSRTRRHVDSRPYTEYVFEGVFTTDKTGRLLTRKANTTHDLTLAA